MTPFVYIMLDRDRTPSPAWKSVPIDTKVQVPGGEIVSLEDLLACWKEARYGHVGKKEPRVADHSGRNRPKGTGADDTPQATGAHHRSTRKGV